MSSIQRVLEQRFFDAMLEVKPEQARFAVKPGKRTAEISPHRTLLDIEQKAQQQRQAGEVARLQFIEFTQAHLHDQVAEELFLKLGRFDTVANTVFNLSEGFPAVLDALSTSVVTLSQLEKLIHIIDWLKEDVLRLVNQPHYLKKSSSPSFVKDLKTALGMIGIETLKQTLPILAFKRCLPFATDPFTSFKSSMWDYSLAVAQAARSLAEDVGEQSYVAFCAGLFQSLGYLVVTRAYLRTYQQIKQNELLLARDARDTALTDALDGLDAEASFLISCFQEFSPVISADLISKWPLQRLPLGHLLDQLAEGVQFQGAHQLTRLVQQAVYYVQSRQLIRLRQITAVEDLQWRQEVGLRDAHLQLLKNTRLDAPQL